MRKMILLALVSVFTTSFTVSSFAGELDDEKSVTNQELNGLVVVRVDSRTNAAAYLKSGVKIENEKEAQSIAKSDQFIAMNESQKRSELDTDGGTSGWYLYYSPYNYNYGYNMYWYGYYYAPVYTYNYGYYNYYYYCRSGWWY